MRGVVMAFEALARYASSRVKARRFRAMLAKKPMWKAFHAIARHAVQSKSIRAAAKRRVARTLHRSMSKCFDAWLRFVAHNKDVKNALARGVGHASYYYFDTWARHVRDIVQERAEAAEEVCTDFN